MGDSHGFKKYSRETPPLEPKASRISHYNEFTEKVDDAFITKQSARCMDCGVPFCHSGCPLGNKIPDFNDAVHNSKWQEAYEILISTNNFPEFTGRICPAPCESACVLGINSEAVSIEFIEKSIIEKAFSEQWIVANKTTNRTGKKITIVGSGPAGLAAADQLNKAGHHVDVYEKNDRIGGLLRYGIPDFKLQKDVIDRRINLMKEEGIRFHCNAEVGTTIDANALKKNSDAMLLCGGSSVPRDLKIEGRNLQGIHFAMDFLEKNNKRIAGDPVDFSMFDLKDKNVIVIGGGDTGSDCIGTSNRLGAKSVVQIELLAKPFEHRTNKDPWPNWPMTLKTSTSQEEGCDREWAIMTKRFISNNGISLSGIEVVDVSWQKDANSKLQLTEEEHSRRVIACDYVFLAIGFLNPQLEGLLTVLNVKLDERNNVKCADYETSTSGIFAAGDMRRGQSLVVWAIAEGREAAVAVDYFLMGEKHKLKSNNQALLTI